MDRNQVAGVVTSLIREHLGCEGGQEGGRRRDSSRGGWAHEPRSVATNMAPEKLGSQDLARASRLFAIPRQLLPGPPAQPGPRWRSGLLTLQREEQQRRQTRAGRSHPGAAGSAPATRRAPRRGSGGADRALGALCTARSSRTRRPASVRPAVPGPPDTQVSQVQLPRRPALSGLAPQCHRHHALPQDPTALHAAGGATPPTSSPATPAAAGLHRAPHRPLAPLGLPGNHRSSATPGGPPAERSLRAAGEAPATCARCHPLPGEPQRAPGTQKLLSSSPTVGSPPRP